MRICVEEFNPHFIYRVGHLGVFCLPKVASGGGVVAVVFYRKTTLCKKG
jgi:hypothetical protein